MSVEWTADGDWTWGELEDEARALAEDLASAEREVERLREAPAEALTHLENAEREATHGKTANAAYIDQEVHRAATILRALSAPRGEKEQHD